MFDELMDELEGGSEVDELEALVLKHQDDYYNGNPTIPDPDYDLLVEKLRKLHPQSRALTKVGASVPKVSAWEKVAHSIPMGSLDKVQTPEEFLDWCAKSGNPTTFLCSDKLDGISISVTYEARYKLASTRGDGAVGEDITQNVALMKGVRPRINDQDETTLRGEIVLHREDLKHFKGQTSTRNTASGTAKRLDGTGSEHLNVYFYQVHGPEFSLDSDQYRWLGSRGFQTPTWNVVTSPQAVIDLWELYQSELREKLPYDIDGMVVRIDDMSHQADLGDLHDRPKGAIAFKFRPLLAKTIAVDLICQVGGTGKITPVAVVEPVILLGAECSRASLYNWAYVKNIGYYIGAEVEILRANDVIPRIERVLSEPRPSVEPPTHCPECGTPTEWDGEYLICPNTAECPAQLEGRLKKWVKELGILEWGDVLIEKVVAEGLATNVPGLYRLTQEQLESLERMGPASAKKALAQLRSVLPLPLDKFVGSLGIPLCASGTMGKVVEGGYDTLDKLRAVTLEQLMAIEGLGPKRSKSLHGWFQRNGSLLDDMLGVGIALKEKVVGHLTGKSFCFTGTMKQKRGDLEKMVEAAGGQLKGAGKGLTFLVIADPNSTTSKAVAARKNGTTCISEEQFLDMVRG